ncbi:MAG: hypothetical protein WA902_04160 [Thermosynechococcaceae cyanobacterium]
MELEQLRSAVHETERQSHDLLFQMAFDEVGPAKRDLAIVRCHLAAEVGESVRCHPLQQKLSSCAPISI